MLKIMTKKAFEKSLAAETEALRQIAETRKQNNDGLRRLLNEAIANLNKAIGQQIEQAKMIKEMEPFADAGRRRKLAEDKRNASMRAKRAARKAGL